MIEETEDQNEPQWLEPSSIGVYQAEFGVFVKSQGFGWIVWEVNKFNQKENKHNASSKPF